MRLRRKTSYETKLGARLTAQRDFLLDTLRAEWDEIQRLAKRERLVERSKEIATAMAKTVLALAAIGGALTAAAVAPKVFGILGTRTGRRSYADEQKLKEVLRYLRRRKLITLSKDGQEFTIRITPRGEARVLKVAYAGLTIQQPKRWDGLWRVVSSDIPDRKKWERDAFRRKLEALGFYQLHESVFVSPHPCRKEVEFLVELFFIGAFVRFIETPIIVPDDDLLERFNLLG